MQDIYHTKEFNDNLDYKGHLDCKGYVDYKRHKICFWISKYVDQIYDQYRTTIHMTCGENSPVLSYSFFGETQELSNKIAEISLEKLKENPRNLVKMFKERS